MDDRLELRKRDGQTVAVWTPWGEQRVPRLEGRSAGLRPLIERLRNAEQADALGAGAVAN